MANNQIIEEILYILRDNAVLLAVILFIVLMMIWGCRKGLMTKLLSLCSVAATLIIEAKVYPIVLAFIRSNEAINSFFSELGMKILTGALMGATMGVTKDTDIAIGTEIPAGGGALDAFAGNSTGLGNLDTGTGIINSPLYELLGLDELADNAAAAIGDTAVKILCFILIFIVVRLLVKLLSALAGGLKKIHFINWIDGFFGAIFGLAESILYIWLFMFVISAFPTYGFCRTVLAQILRDPLLYAIYNQNLIMQFFVGMLN